MDKQPSFLSDRPAVVLIVDDDPDNLELLHHQVSLLINCSVISASDGKTALSLAKEFRPDLILLDIWLPEMDGFQVVRQLKQDPYTRQIPVIAVTAAAKFQEQVLALQVGFDDYVRKPYDIEVLEATIHRHLGQSRSIETQVERQEEGQEVFRSL